MRKGITARPGTTMDDTQDSPCTSGSRNPHREEAAALGETVIDIVPRAIAGASGMHRDRGEDGETLEEERT